MSRKRTVSPEARERKREGDRARTLAMKAGEVPLTKGEKLKLSSPDYHCRVALSASQMVVQDRAQRDDKRLGWCYRTECARRAAQGEMQIILSAIRLEAQLTKAQAALH
jgi:hypothetical protein